MSCCVRDGLASAIFPFHKLDVMLILIRAVQTAVIKEGLRMSHGVVTPPVRVVPPEGGSLGGHAIPGGVCLLRSPCLFLSS